METTRFFSESQIVLKQQEELVGNVEKITAKFSESIAKYKLETADELLCALESRMEKLNMHLAEYKRIISMIDPIFMESVQNMFSNIENYIGQIEKDEDGFLHCGKCMVPYTYCQNMIGKKVRISLITFNTNKSSKNKYPTFAKHIDVVE